MTFTVVGQGLAGTWVALELQRAGHHVRVVDPLVTGTSSRVAAGIINPITGQRLKPTWRGAELIPQARYAFMGFGVWRDVELRHAFRNEETMSWFERRMASHELDDLQLTRIDAGVYEGITYPHGGCSVPNAAMVDVAEFLSRGRTALLCNGAEFVNDFTTPDTVDAITWQHAHMSDGIIWCTGIETLQNPLWTWLTLEPSKGEMLEVQFAKMGEGLRAEYVTGRPLPYILNSGTWIAPLENGNYLVGATNDWDDHTSVRTTEARNTLLAEARRMTDSTFAVIDQRVAIRPSTLRKRPLIAKHPVDSRHAVLTGLGSKGCLVAPWAASQLVQHLLHDAPIDSEVNALQDYPNV